MIPSTFIQQQLCILYILGEGGGCYRHIHQKKKRMNICTLKHGYFTFDFLSCNQMFWPIILTNQATVVLATLLAACKKCYRNKAVRIDSGVG